MNYKNKLIFISVFILLIFSFNNIYAEENINYLGNFEFELLNNGNTIINSNTNYEPLNVES